MVHNRVCVARRHRRVSCQGRVPKPREFFCLHPFKYVFTDPTIVKDVESEKNLIIKVPMFLSSFTMLCSFVLAMPVPWNLP